MFYCAPSRIKMDPVLNFKTEALNLLEDKMAKTVEDKHFLIKIRIVQDIT